MPNAHSNTVQIRVPRRAAERLRLVGKAKNLTVSTAVDRIVTHYCQTQGLEEILEATADLPEPRGAMPRGVAVGPAIQA